MMGVSVLQALVATMVPMSELKQVFGDRLREARKKKGVSRADLAEALSIAEGAEEPSGQQRIANYELGYSEPAWTVLLHLSNILEVSMDWLSGRDPEGLDERFERLRFIYHHTDERGRDGIFGYASTQPVESDRECNDEAKSA